jgi:DNA-directed RNA polymerase specialized sigma24 family protein
MAYSSISEACGVLGVPASATDDDINKRWRQLARKYHPDLNPNDEGAAKEFKKYREAFEVLNTFRSGSRTVAALEEEFLSEFPDWIKHLPKEKREKIMRELSELESSDKE